LFLLQHPLLWAWCIIIILHISALLVFVHAAGGWLKPDARISITSKNEISFMMNGKVTYSDVNYK